MSLASGATAHGSVLYVCLIGLIFRTAGLQEADRGVKRTEGRDEIAELAKMTDMRYAFSHNLDYLRILKAH